MFLHALVVFNSTNLTSLAMIFNLSLDDHSCEFWHLTSTRPESSPGSRETAVTLSTSHHLPLTMANIDRLMTPTERYIDLLLLNVGHTQSNELQSTTACHICQEPFLTGTNPERPATLPCGHIFGDGCIVKWISPLSSNGVRNSCPLCRKPIFQLSAQKRVTVQERPIAQEQPTAQEGRIAQLMYFRVFLICAVFLTFIGMICLAGLAGIIRSWKDPDWLDLLCIFEFGLFITILGRLSDNFMKRRAQLYELQDN